MTARQVWGLLLAISLHTAGLACENLQVNEAWIRLPPPGAPHAAAYAVLNNRGSRPLLITGLTSGDFDFAALHQVTYVEGQAQMRHLEHLALEPGASFRFAPGGAHIMLGKSQASLKAGMLLELGFVCQDGAGHSAWFEVRRDAPH